MLDHVFTDAISALREAFEGAFLERQAFEEHFQVDVLLGDIVWETSYGLPGEGSPPRVEAHITFEWPTWSQTAYRRWYLEELFEDPPVIDIEIILRVQRLATTPDLRGMLGVLPTTSPPIGRDGLERGGPTVESAYSTDPLEPPVLAIEVSYEGSYELAEETLADGASKTLDEHFSALGGWISSMLVRLGDLKLDYLPPDEDES
ncbi:MAG: hypothetical protein ABJD24_18090 [Acidimicrobiales bacterium]